ncbi:head-tail connector protein [Citreicella sp. C3M06]|uniref:head-tail connector protein n=1 Tax=Roseobacteraceae TaxID=2854170 RepID=UPI001C095DEE|nr:MULTISPECIES: head-tail connector protein [Roseobacteraceae]MBU2960134.1 head-tail connector protein [Citreicella sp. C3M06]MDO6586048.1 head-tail connector protein [Salipiger sp. 1_MG-2023]
MMLIEETQVPDAALPVDALKRHLRLGSGFAEDDVQDAVLGSFLRAAMAAVEARTGKALISRGFVWTLHQWRDPQAAVFPIAPVSAVSQLAIVDRFGAAELREASDYRLEQDGFAPKLRPMASVLPGIPGGGAAEIRFTAGYGPGFDDLPADIAQAVLLLAAHYYEYRDETSLSQGCMPFGVTSLIARYRPMRMGFGA